MNGKPTMNGITFAVVSAAMVILSGGVLLVVARVGRSSSVALPVTTTSAPPTTLPPTTLAPATLPPVTIPPVTRPPVYVPTPTTATIPPPTYPPPRAGQVVTLPINFMRYAPTTTVPLTVPPSHPAVGVMAATLANNSGGCHAGVCISLASKNGDGPIIIAWDASSSTGQSCAQFEYRVDGLVYAESPKACDGPGIYSTTWAPDAVMGFQLCSEDLVVSETACENDQASGFPY